MNAPLRLGATVVVLPRFDLDTFLAAIEKYRINALYVAPPIVLALAKHPAVEGYDLVVVLVRNPAWPVDAVVTSGVPTFDAVNALDEPTGAHHERL